MCCKVAAVDHRDIDRQQRLQILGVVPIIEMALMSLQRRHGTQRVAGALEQLAGRYVAEVVRGKICQQRQADVGGRGTPRNDGHRMLLNVVGWQPVVFRSDIGLEETPGLAGQPVQVSALAVVQGSGLAQRRLADPPGHCRCQQPQQQQRCRADQAMRLQQRQQSRHDQRKCRRKPHIAQLAAERIIGAVRRLAGDPVFNPCGT